MENSFLTFNGLFHALLDEKEKKKRNVISFAQTIIHQNNCFVFFCLVMMPLKLFIFPVISFNYVYIWFHLIDSHGRMEMCI